jgi:hypothetical protein
MSFPGSEVSGGSRAIRSAYAQAGISSLISILVQENRAITSNNNATYFNWWKFKFVTGKFQKVQPLKGTQGLVKNLEYPHRDSNAGFCLRRATLYPLSYGGCILSRFYHGKIFSIDY